MSAPVDERWQAYARVTAGCLGTCGSALQRLGLGLADETALKDVFMAMYRCRIEMQDMDLPIIASLAGQIEAICGVLLIVGQGLDEETLFLLVEAYGALHASVEVSVACQRDIRLRDWAGLEQRLNARYDDFLLQRAGLR